MKTYRVRVAWLEDGQADTATREVTARCGAEACELVMQRIAQAYRGGDERGLHVVECEPVSLIESVTERSARPLLARGAAR